MCLFCYIFFEVRSPVLQIFLLCFLDTCQIPVILYATSNEIKSYATINNVTSSAILAHTDVTDMAYDSSSGRLYYYNSSDGGTFYSVKLDGSDSRAVIKAERVLRFTFDSERKVIYYIRGQTDQIHSVNITSMQDIPISELSAATDAKDLDMDTNG